MTALALLERTREFLRSPRGKQRATFLRVLGYGEEQIIGNAVLSARICDQTPEPLEYERIEDVVRELMAEEAEARR